MDYTDYFDEIDDMKTAKDEYQELELVLKEINERIDVLKEDKLIKKYNELLTVKEILQKKSKRLYREVKIEEYKDCYHILVDLKEYQKIIATLGSDVKSECFKGVYRGCIKCGLHGDIIDKAYDGDLSEDEQIMLDFLLRGTDYPMDQLNGINLNIKCDLELAKSIYKKIKEANPNIDDKEACGYFMSAYFNMKRNNNPDKIKSRIRRLSLDNTNESR